MRMIASGRAGWLLLTAVPVAWAVAASQAAAAQDPAAEVAGAIVEHLDREVAAGRFAGAVIVARGGVPIVAWAGGLADRATGRRHSLDTPINLGSMNKMFTGLAIAQLVREKRLGWQDTVGKYLPGYPVAEVRDKVTIEQLLTHSSGIPSYWNDRYARSKDTISTLDGFLETFVNEPLEFEPGTDSRYSNGGPVILGLIIEAVTGESYYDYVRSNIYEPAGMEHAGHFLTTDRTAGFAVGYDRPSPDAPFESNAGSLGLRGSPAGGGYASARDLLSFARALGDGRLLPPDGLEQLWLPRRQLSDELGYGYLWGTGSVHGHRWVGHNGGAPGVSADFRYFPEDGSSVIVLSNLSRAAMPVSRWIVERITQEPAPQASVGAGGSASSTP